jgi:Ca2+-binding EF-hand superfamily protein
MSNTAVQEAFDRMDPDMTGEVGFEAFRRWRKLKMDMYRRELHAEQRARGL